MRPFSKLLLNTAEAAVTGQVKLAPSKAAIQMSTELIQSSLQTLNLYKQQKAAASVVAQHINSSESFTPPVDMESVARAMDTLRITPPGIKTMLYQLQLGGVGVGSAHFAEESRLVPDAAREGLSMFVKGVVGPSHKALVQDQPDEAWKPTLRAVDKIPGIGLSAVVTGVFPHVEKDFGDTFTMLRKEGVVVDPEAYFYSFFPIPGISRINEAIVQEYSAAPNLFAAGNQIGRVLLGQDDPFIRLARERAYVNYYRHTPQGRDFVELQNLRDMRDPQITRNIEFARKEGEQIGLKLVKPVIDREILKLTSS